MHALHRDSGCSDLERHLPSHFSVSALNAYLRCGRQWMYERIYRLPTVPHVNATAGTHAHRVLEHLMQADADDRTLEESLAINAALVVKLDAALAELAGIDDDQDRRDLARAMGHADEDLRHLVELVQVQDQREVFDARTIDALHGYFDLSRDPGAVDLIGTERDLVVTLDTPSGPVPFRALIDRLDRLPEEFGGGVMVVDYKTGRGDGPPLGRRCAPTSDPALCRGRGARHGELLSQGLLLYVNAREVKQVWITCAEVDRVLILLGRVWREACGHAWTTIATTDPDRRRCVGGALSWTCARRRPRCASAPGLRKAPRLRADAPARTLSISGRDRSRRERQRIAAARARGRLRRPCRRPDARRRPHVQDIYAEDHEEHAGCRREVADEPWCRDQHQSDEEFHGGVEVERHQVEDTTRERGHERHRQVDAGQQVGQGRREPLCSSVGASANTATVT